VIVGLPWHCLQILNLDDGLNLMLQFTSCHDNAATNLANSGWTRDALLIRTNSSSQSRNSLWQWQPFCSTDGASTSIRMAGMSLKPFFSVWTDD
jgi:hypothetical protein